MAAKREFLPETPEEITPDWLSEVLGGEVRNVNVRALGDGQGFMGDVLLLDIDSPSAEVPASLVAKMPKKSNRTMGEMLGVYEREVMFFRDLASDLPVRVPRLYFSEFDRDKGSEKQGELLRSLARVPLFMAHLVGVVGGFIAASKKRRYMLLIEYFGEMQPGDQLAGLDAAGCIQALQGILPWHRKYWAHPVLQEHFWLLELDIDARMRQGIYNKHVDSYVQTMGAEFKPHLLWLRDHGEELLQQFSRQAPHTLLHGDLRLDNVVFDGSECAFIDFQMVRHGPAAYDVAYFLSSALHASASEDDVDQILQSYHAALEQPGYDFDSFKRDYQRGLMVVLAGLSSVEDVELGNDRGETMMAAWLERLRARVRDIDFEQLLED